MLLKRMLYPLRLKIKQGEYTYTTDVYLGAQAGG